MKLLFFALFILLACSRPQDYVLIVDTSGSMKKDNQLETVKQSIKKILLKYKKNDRIHLLTFDSTTNLKSTYTVRDNEDIVKLFEIIDLISAEGKWTNLIGVMDDSLQTVRDIQVEYPGRKTILILYTDGKHDLPPGHKDSTNLNFDDLFNKYYKDYDPNKPNWYIYYVELDFPDEKLKSFLQKTQSGEVITSQQLKENPDFIFKVNDLMLVLKWSGIGILILILLHTLLFFFRPWFKNVSFTCITPKSMSAGHPLSYKLGDTGKSYFRNYLIIGSDGELPIVGAEIDPKHAGLGMTLFGNYFIKPLKKNRVKVNGRLINGKTLINTSSKIQIGFNDFVLQKDQGR